MVDIIQIIQYVKYVLNSALDDPGQMHGGLPLRHIPLTNIVFFIFLADDPKKHPKWFFVDLARAGTIADLERFTFM